ncbi:MAG: coenzyme F420-0:L-glutamate ligase [Microgenomates group bacterium]
MKIRAIKTKAIILGDDIFSILNNAIPKLTDNCVVAVTSKIISICEGNIVKIGTRDKQELMAEQAELFLPPQYSAYGFTLTMKHSVLIPSAGIDESNGNGYYVLWPRNPQNTANKIREHLVKKHNVKNIGVIIVDSKTTALRLGVTGVAIVHSGFEALNNYIGKPDIFNRPFKVEKVNVSDGLAASAVLVMGEGNEQTPIVIIDDVPFVHFQQRNPTKEELDILKISIDEDLYSPLLKNVPWEKGGAFSVV